MAYCNLSNSLETRVLMSPFAQLKPFLHSFYNNNQDLEASASTELNLLLYHSIASLLKHHKCMILSIRSYLI